MRTMSPTIPTVATAVKGPALGGAGGCGGSGAPHAQSATVASIKMNRTRKPDRVVEGLLYAEVMVVCELALALGALRS